MTRGAGGTTTLAEFSAADRNDVATATVSKADVVLIAEKEGKMKGLP